MSEQTTTEKKQPRLTKKGQPDKRSLGSSSKNLKKAQKVIVRALNKVVDEGDDGDDYETDSSEELEIIKEVEKPIVEVKLIEEKPVIDYSKIIEEKEFNIRDLTDKLSNWEIKHKDELEKLNKEKEEAVRNAKLGRIESLRHRMVVKF